MRIIYMGTPQFAVPALDALLSSRHEVVAVCTQPDRPSGRGYKLTPSAVKARALEHGLPVHQPETLRISEAKEIRAQLERYNSDVFVVAAYGLLLPKGVLEMPRFGCINIHGSLLPKYRGAAPIHAALLNGDKTTGVTIMHMDTGLDTGDMILKREIAIAANDRFENLYERMAELGASALIEALDMLENGTAIRTPQDDTLSCYAPMLKKSDAIIDWEWDTTRIINMTRALDPWPGSQTVYDGKPLKIWRLENTSDVYKNKAGTVLAVDPARGILIKTGDSAAWATELQGDGSKRMPATDYLRGRKIEVGAVLG